MLRIVDVCGCGLMAISPIGVSTVGRMADVLVGAKQQAEKIILERLNGYNCVKQYVAMGTLLANISRKKEELVVLKRHVMEVSVGLSTVSMYQEVYSFYGILQKKP